MYQRSRLDGMIHEGADVERLKTTVAAGGLISVRFRVTCNIEDCLGCVIQYNTGCTLLEVDRYSCV